MKKTIFLALSIIFLYVQCNSKKNAPSQITVDTTTKTNTTAKMDPSIQYGIVIASKQVDCQEEASQKCYLTKSLGATKWNFLSSPIEGFNHEQGYEYHLEIKETAIKNPAATKYELVRIISKEKKDSDIRMEAEKPVFESTWDVVILNGQELKGYLSFKNNGSANANVGCNTMSGIKFTIDPTKKTIRFNTEMVASTMMACPEDYDTAFQMTLAKVTHFEEVSKNSLLLKENTITLIELSR